ncbi:carboxylesterase [Lyophyllum atratum]|nr:carboxylesterase [Lyophyllum atratum]
MIIQILLALSLTIATSGQSSGLTVRTHQGDVTGTLVSPTVRQFLGSVGGSDPPTRGVPLRATAFGDSCLQALNGGSLEFLKLAGAGNVTVPESENCLSVNIWAPSTVRKQGTAVMLWVYGGSFQFGTSNQPIYIGRNLVRDNDDVLVVTFNYRLNIFGFPNAPQLVSPTQPQNFGLLDLDAAVQWVHENIAAFGGDPERIVLFGQSAGAAAIDAYTFAHPHDTIVKGVIEQSGNLGLPITGATSSNSTLDVAAWNQVASVVGCGNGEVQCQITVLQELTGTSNGHDTAGVRLVHRDILISLIPLSVGISLFSDTSARSANGNFLRVPLLGGTTAQEGDIFIVGAEDEASGITVPLLTELLSDLLTQLTFTCPAGTTASDRVKAGVPTWRYQYQAVFPDISTRPDLRAYHASEIPVKFVQRAWVAFARDPQQGLVKFGWPKYAPDTTSLAQIGNFFNQTGVVFTQGQLLDFTCNFTPTLRSVNAQLTALLGPAAVRSI